MEWSHKHQTQEAEWKCISCGEGNWMSRTYCRGCKANWKEKDKDKSTGITRAREDDRSKIEALQSVVDSMGDNALLEEHKQKLMAEIVSLVKKTTDTRSLAKQLVTLEGWVEREEKRILHAEEELEVSRVTLETRKVDLQIEIAKLISLRETLVKEAETKPDEPQTEMDIDVPVLESQELAIRRQLAGKKDDKGLPIIAKRMKEMVKEADDIREKIAKRVKINDEPKETADSTAPRSA